MEETKRAGASKPSPSKKTKAALTKANAPKATLIARSVAEKQSRLEAEGRADVELILRRRERIAEDFYDIGEALARLKRPGVAQALGHASFPDLCDTELGISAAKATYLIAIVTHVPRAEASKLGQDRTAALLELADATPAADTVTELAKGVLKLPGGKELHIPKASAAEIRSAAKAIRAENRKSSVATTKPARGRTTTSEERERASKLQTRLHALGLEHAKVTAVAAKPGQASNIRIEGIPIDKLAMLKKAL